GGPRHVVLDQRAALEHGDLRGRRADVDAHRVAADGLALALPAPPALERRLVEVGRCLGDDGLDRPGVVPALARGRLGGGPPRAAGGRRGGGPPPAAARATALAALLRRRAGLPGLAGRDLGQHLGRDRVADLGLGRRLGHERGRGRLDARRPALAVEVGELGRAVVVERRGRGRRAPPAPGLAGLAALGRGALARGRRRRGLGGRGGLAGVLGAGAALGPRLAALAAAAAAAPAPLAAAAATVAAVTGPVLGAAGAGAVGRRPLDRRRGGRLDRGAVHRR